MHPFRRLSVWLKAHELTLATYRVADAVSYRKFPGLGDQLRRAVMSIPTNIAEGTGRDTPEQFAYFLEIAIASAHEVDYLLLLAADLDAISKSDHAKLEARTDVVARMLSALRSTVRNRALGKREGAKAVARKSARPRRADPAVHRLPSTV